MESKDFITPQGLQQLKNYHYKPGKATIIDGLLTPYWNWAVTLVPLWMAPNLITFIGWLLMVLSYAIMLYYDYTFQKDIPNWCFLFAAAATWIYSTLDAIDGKQARRTQSSSPLGQLFDHGCDSFTVTFMALSLAQATKLTGIQVFIFFIANHIAFWNACWRQYNTGVLQTNVGQFGVTQAELSGIAVHLITGIFGQDAWQLKIGDIIPQGWITNELLQPTLGLTLGGFTAYYFGGLILVSGVYLFLHTLITAQDKKKCVRQCFTFYVTVILLVVWINTSFYQGYRGMVLLNFGLFFSLLVCKVIISSVTKMPLPFFHEEAVPIFLGTSSLAACEFFQGYQVMQQLFWLVFVVNVIIIILFLYRAVEQITVHLGIYCFSLKKRPQLKEE